MKQNYAKFGLKQEELDKLASHIAGGLTDETTDDDLNTAVENAKFYAEMMQSVGNRKATEIQNKYKGYIPKPVEEEKPLTPPAGTLTLEQVKQMIAEANKDREQAIADAVSKATQPFLQQQEKERLANLLQNSEKLKTIPKMFREKYVLDKEEDLESVVNRIESDYTAFKQDLIASGQFVEAPAQTTPESETDDFIKQMQGFGERNAPAPAETK